MSQSNVQVLLHEGELLYITHIIEETLQTKGNFVGGCLFGLWRNSLKQPVIQFVTGPSKEFRQELRLEAFCNSEYNAKCGDILRKGHAMLKLGYWFYGLDDKKEKVKNNLTSCNVLLFISLIDQKLLGDFFLRKDGNKEYSSLCKEDVLPGNSSFRIYQPLTEAVDKGAKFHSLNNNDPHQALSTYIDQLPSRLQVRDPETKKEQWYSSEDGTQLLQTLVQYLNSASIQVEMSRDATTHNIQFNLDGGYCLDFPVDFPRCMPGFYDPRGDQIRVRYQRGQDDDVCRMIVDAVRPYCKREARY